MKLGYREETKSTLVSGSLLGVRREKESNGVEGRGKRRRERPRGCSGGWSSLVREDGGVMKAADVMSSFGVANPFIVRRRRRERGSLTLWLQLRVSERVEGSSVWRSFFQNFPPIQRLPWKYSIMTSLSRDHPLKFFC